MFKYGISSKPIDEDGYSSRMREQVDFLNRAVGWFRFFAEVLVHGIPGRTKARQLEDEYIEAYHQKHGRNPREMRNSVLHQSLSSSNLLTQSFPYYPTKSYLCVFTK